MLSVEEGKIEAPGHQHLTRLKASRADLVAVLEPIIPDTFGHGACGHIPCPDGWADVQKRLAKVVYVSSMLNLRHFNRRIYIDGGARGFGSSIGSWFNGVYPQAERFEVFAFEIDERFGSSYADKAGVTFLPCGMWTQDDTIPMFGSSMKTLLSTSDVAKGKGRQPQEPSLAYVLDFSEWLLQTVSLEDFVVIKLDIEGAEHEVIPHLIETGAIYLIDELFVECHYNVWSRMRLDKTREDCLALLNSVKELDVPLHEWF